MAAARARLAAVVEDPDTDAKALACHALRRGRAWLIAHGDEVFPPARRAVFDGLVEERRQGRPVAHLLGHREFWGRCLKVTPDTLIPRPETEDLVERALGLDLPDNAAVLDFGTGGGAVAVALCLERPRWRIHAMDISLPALRVARENARRHNAGQIRFRHGAAPALYRRGFFHLIVSNPPYIAQDDPHLTRGDLRFEPRVALLGGADGMACLAYLIQHAPPRLRRGGRLLLEHGAEQGARARALLRQRGYTDITTSKDLAGHERVTGAAYA